MLLEQAKIQKLIKFLNAAATALFLCFLIITYLYPEILANIRMTSQEANTVLMNLISLMLLLAFMQIHLSISWRIFCLIASFIVAIESILMLGAWQQIFK